MDAVEFLKSYKRMCESNSRFLQIDLSRADFESMVSDTEQWIKDHPIKTRQNEFLKAFPNAFVEDGGVLSISPCNVDRTVKGACAKKTCMDCRREFWLREVE